MPTEMLSLRSFRLASTTGHCAIFEANVPRMVPDILVQEAMAAGCAPVNKADIPFYEDMGRAKVEFQGDLRRSTVYLAVQSIIEANDMKHFDGGGVPKAESVSERLGYTVNRDEVLSTFRLYTTAKSENREYGLHPQAQNILRVIDADTKAELVELAEEFGIEKDKAKGLTARELRKLLLTKFSGNVAAA